MASASNRLDRPAILFSDPHRVFLELPSGKIGKDGETKVQKGQKGHTCVIYAMKRLLTAEQIHSAHGQACSMRRKMITAEGAAFSSVQEYHEMRTKANVVFLKTKGCDPIKAARLFWVETLKQTMAEVPAKFLTTAKLEEVMTQTDPIIGQAKPWYQLERVEVAAEQSMARGHGLKEVPCKDLGTIQNLIIALQTKGPLLMKGRFGPYFYADTPAEKLAVKIGTHALYGWKRGTPTSEHPGMLHAIVLIGAEVKGERKYVYWINPEDSNDPNDESPPVYASSFETIVSRMVAFAGIPLDDMSLEARTVMAGAFYNPAFAPSTKLA